MKKLLLLFVLVLLFTGCKRTVYEYTGKVKVIHTNGHETIESYKIRTFEDDVPSYDVYGAGALDNGPLILDVSIGPFRRDIAYDVSSYLVLNEDKKKLPESYRLYN